MSTMRLSLLIFGCSTMMHLLDGRKTRRKAYQTASAVYKGDSAFDIEFMKEACSSLGDWVPARIDNEANNDKATAACKEGSQQLCLIDIYRTYFGDSSHWYHIDDIHSAVQYSNWEATQPGLNEACVVVVSDTGEWHDVPCDYGLPVLCMPQDEYPERTQLPYDAIASKYQAANGRFTATSEYDSIFVQDACSSLEGDYVTARIDTAEDNMQATDACRASGYETCLLGFYRQAIGNRWIITDDPHDRNGQSYFNWEGGQHGSLGGCVALFSTTGEWQDVPCDQGSYGVLCLPESQYPVRTPHCEGETWQMYLYVIAKYPIDYYPEPCKCQAAGSCSNPIGFDSWVWATTSPDSLWYSESSPNICLGDDSQTCCCEDELKNHLSAINAPINMDEPVQMHVHEPKMDPTPFTHDNDWNFMISILISVFVPICILGCLFWCWFVYGHHSAKVKVDFSVD